MENFLQDFRFAIRQFLRSPLFACTAVLTLALGIGPTVAIFSILHNTLRLSYPAANELVAIKNRYPNGSYLSVSYPDFQTWRKQTSGFSKLVALFPTRKVYTGGREPLRVNVSEISHDFLDTFGVRPLLGRDFLLSDQHAGASSACLLNERFWRSEFGANPSVIGRAIVLDHVAYTVVGVIPNMRSVLIREPAIWVPLEAAPPWKEHGTNYLVAIGRLRSGTGIEQAESDLRVVQSRIDAQFPANKHDIELQPLTEALFGKVQRIVLIMFATVLFVLLIACANLAGMLFARGSDRRQEFAMRHALGASPARLLLQNLVEGFCLSIIGTGAGILLAGLLMLIPIPAWPSSLQPPSQIQLDLKLLSFVVVLVFVTTLMFATIPAIRTLQGSLRVGEISNRATSSRGDRLFRFIFLVMEFAFASVLLAGAVGMTMEFDRLLHTDSGMDPEHVLTMSISLSPLRYPNSQSAERFYESLLETLKRQPSVVEVAATSETPFDGRAQTSDFHYDGEPNSSSRQLPFAENYFITPSYFRTVGTRMIDGRAFLPSDRQDSILVVIINRRMAQQLWPGESPLGKRIQAAGGWHQVIGVAADVRSAGVAQPVPFQMYFATAQHTPPAVTILIKTVLPPLELAQAAKGVVYGLDADQAVSNLTAMTQLASQSIAGENTSTAVIVAFGSLALLLAAIGVYGVTAYSASLRRKEFGIRMALGAQPWDILKSLLAEVGYMLLLGIGMGATLTFFLGRWVRTLLVDVTGISWGGFLFASLLLGAISVLASLIPAKRALSIEPLRTLNSE